MDKISVIVPAYNAENYVSNCIESILRQSYSYFELILIDDGSIDNSLNICKEYEKRDPRIKVYTQPNSGPSTARNKGLKNITGTYITFVDSDDFIDENF